MLKKNRPISNLSRCLNEIKGHWQKEGSLGGIWTDWEKIAGVQLAANCVPIKLYRGILFVGASHPQWRQALQYTRPQLIAALRAAGHQIQDLRIQQHHPEKKQSLESEATIWARHPSRIDVHGLTTCKSCKSPAPLGEMALWGKCGFCRRKELGNNSS